MLVNVALRNVLKSSAAVVRESGALCSALPAKPWTCSSSLLSGQRVSCVAGSFAFPPPVRHYARVVKQQDTGHVSQLSDLPAATMKLDYSAVPLAQTADDLVKRLLSLELACQSEKLQIKKEQMIAKVQKDENDRTSVEVQVAILTAKIRNLQEHMQKHRKDKSNKRRLLMAIDRRKKLLKRLRFVRYDAFENVCKQLDITYTFPPAYYRRATSRWLAKKAFCIKVYKQVQKQKAEQRLMMAEAAKTKQDETQ